MNDFFQFIVMNSWKINTNLPFLFGDRQAVKSGSKVFPVRTCIGWEISLPKTGVFFPPKEGGVRRCIKYFCIVFQPFINYFKIEINHSLR